MSSVKDVWSEIPSCRFSFIERMEDYIKEGKPLIR